MKQISFVITCAKKSIKIVKQAVANYEKINDDRVEFIVVYRNDSENNYDGIFNNIAIKENIIKITDEKLKKIGKYEIGVKKATGRYIKSLDPDDFFITENMTKYVDEVSKRNEDIINEPFIIRRDKYDEIQKTDKIIFWTPSIMFLRDKMSNISYEYDEIYQEDIYRAFVFLNKNRKATRGVINTKVLIYNLSLEFESSSIRSTTYQQRFNSLSYLLNTMNDKLEFKHGKLSKILINKFITGSTHELLADSYKVYDETLYIKIMKKFIRSKLFFEKTKSLNPKEKNIIKKTLDSSIANDSNEDLTNTIPAEESEYKIWKKLANSLNSSTEKSFSTSNDVFLKKEEIKKLENPYWIKIFSHSTFKIFDLIYENINPIFFIKNLNAVNSFEIIADIIRTELLFSEKKDNDLLGIVQNLYEYASIVLPEKKDSLYNWSKSMEVILSNGRKELTTILREQISIDFKSFYQDFIKSGIKIYLHAGTLLGAVRHNGNIIPWDDDIDLVMSTGEIKRHWKTIKRILFEKGLEIENMVEKGNGSPYYKIYRREPFLYKGIEMNIFIDLMVASNRGEKYIKKMGKLSKITLEKWVFEKYLNDKIFIDKSKKILNGIKRRHRVNSYKERLINSMQQDDMENEKIFYRYDWQAKKLHKLKLGNNKIMFLGEEALIMDNHIEYLEHFYGSKWNKVPSKIIYGKHLDEVINKK